MSIHSIFIKAALGTMLASAFIHMGIVWGRILASGDWQLLNFFTLMDIYSIAPWLPRGAAGWWWSQLFCAMLYGAVLAGLWYLRHQRQPRLPDDKS